jgi:hypothetical protein
MFLMSAVFINGKQANAEFRQGMNDINSQLQQVINEVGNGYYPSNNDVTCTASGGSGSVSITTGSKEQGTNQTCVFLGKLIQFGVGDPAPGIDIHTAYNIYTVAGRQYTGTNGAVPTNFVDSNPEIVDVPSAIDKKTLQWGLHLTGMYDKSSGSQPICGIGLFGTFASSNANGLESGAQTVNLKPVPNISCLGHNHTAFMGTFNSAAAAQLDSNTTANPNILLCFKGGQGQYGSITLGGSTGQRLKTTVNIATNASSPPGTCPNADTY